MKRLLVVLSLAALVGCQTLPGKDVTVAVDKPIAVVPIPPDVPKFKSQVDQLVDTDVKDPGKVGQAYKYDMTALRALIRIYEQILDQYRQSSQNFDGINSQITDLYKNLNTNPAVNPPLPASAPH